MSRYRQGLAEMDATSSVAMVPPVEAERSAALSAGAVNCPAPPARGAAALKALVIRSVDGAGGGAEKIILRTAGHADRERLQLTICAIYRRGDCRFDFVERGQKVGARVIPVLQRSLWDGEVQRSLNAIVKNGDFDLVHGHDYKANFYALRIAKRHGLPAVSTAHGWTGHLWREQRVYYPVDKRLLRKFHAVICVSSDIRNELLRAGAPPLRLRTVLNGINAQKYQRNDETRGAVRRELGFGPQAIVIGAVGRVEPQKRFDLLIEAFARLARHSSELQLLIVGAGSLLEPLRAEVRRRGLEQRCRLVGQRADMLRLYQAFDMYVQSSDYEGTPTVLVEAMAMRIPIVATDAGGTTELVRPGEHGLIVPKQDVEALCSAIECTLAQPELTLQRIEVGRRRTEQELSLDYRTEQVIDAYRHAASVFRRENEKRRGKRQRG
ncbi:MAG: glycosyltransferase [Pirellulales bacterium]|nr:glycosyltransferase [Pirellulales bacterium]